MSVLTLPSSRRRPAGGRQCETPTGLNKHAILSAVEFPCQTLICGRVQLCASARRARRALATHSARRTSTAMKKPSVPCRAGVSSKASSLPSADAGGVAADARLPGFAPRQRREVRMVRQEPGDLVAILLGQHRAGDVDEPAAGLHQRRGERQDARAAPPGAARDWPASAATWRRAGGARRPCRCRAHRRTRGRSAGPAPPAPPLSPGVQHLHVARAGPLQALEDRAQPRALVVVGVDLAGVVHGGGNRQRLAAGTCTNVEHLLARARRRPSAPRSASPSSCTSYQPLPWPASASTLGCRPAPSGAGRRTPSGDKGVGSGAKRGQRLQHLRRGRP